MALAVASAPEETHVNKSNQITPLYEIIYLSCIFKIVNFYFLT